MKVLIEVDYRIMTNVAFIITKPIVGGAQTWIKDQIRLLDGNINPIIITSEPGWLSESCPDVKSYFVKGINKRLSVKTIFDVKTILKCNKIQTVVASSANAGLYARLVKIFYKCRVVYVSHGWSCIYNGGRFKKLYINIEKILSYLSDVVLCVSKKDTENALKVIGIKSSKIVTIRNSVFIKDEKKKKENNTFKFLFLGRLTYPKRVDLLIDAFEKIKDVELVIVGDGPQRSKCSSENISFLGEIKSFNDFKNYDAFILLSDSEGLPMSALEAASSGLPLILSNVGGCSELISNNGILVENNIDEIIKAILHVRDNSSLYYKNALEMKDAFNIENDKELYRSLYI
ncbi:glycosyltransferase [Photobacterium leiognathi]|uniref:glycosyltransferase n=1 Tax=Photobacterium leiognathi TaxID=553611 RepID=UPI0029813929|nr:glycosyltransferase [Photobacterium leiognathi]